MCIKPRATSLPSSKYRLFLSNCHMVCVILTVFIMMTFNGITWWIASYCIMMIWLACLACEL